MKKHIIIFILFSFFINFFCFSFEKGEERFYVASKAFSDGFYEASLSLFQRFIQENPSSSMSNEARLHVAKCYYYLENYPESLSVLESLEAENDFHDLDEEVYYWLSAIHYKGKDFKKSLYYANKIINEYPESNFLWWALFIAADNNAELSNNDEAISGYSKVIEESKDPRLVDDSYSKLFSIHFGLRQYSQVIDLATQYIKEYPKGQLRAKAYFYLGESHYGQDKPQEALTDYKYALTSNPSESIKNLTYQGLGSAYIAQNNNLEAKLNIDKITDQELRLFSQSIYYFKTKSYIEALESFDIFLRNYSESNFRVAAYLNKADLLYEMGRVNDAISAYQTIINDFNTPEYSKTVNKARYGLSWCYLKNGKFKEAIDGFESTLEATDNVVVRMSSQIQIADTYHETGKYDKALDAYNQILKQYPNTIYADYIQFQIGVVFLKKKDLDNALMALRNLKQNFPKSKLIPKAQYYLAVSYFSQGKYSESKNLLEDFIEDFSNDDFMAKVYYLYGKAFYNEGSYAQALDKFKIAVSKYRDVDIEEFVYIDIGNVYFNLGDFDKAKKTWNDFLVRFPGSQYAGSVALYLGGVCEKENSYIEAEKYYKKVMNEFEGTSWSYEAMLSLGHLYWSMNNLEVAERYFRDLSKKNTPLAVKGKLYLAEVLSGKGNEKESLELYDQLIHSKSSVSKIALVNKASLFRQLQEYGQAAVLYEKAIEEGVDGPDIVFSLALCNEKAGNEDKAIEYYFKVVYAFSDDAPKDDLGNFMSYKTRAYFRIARIYEKQGKLEEARLIYDKIVSMDVKESRIAQSRLEEIKANNR
jgi:tetratricopeptide (TPR) repeat protein